MTIKTYAIPPEGCASYLTPGKRYEADNADNSRFSVIDDEGDRISCCWTRCYHANGNWQRIEEDDATEAGGVGEVIPTWEQRCNAHPAHEGIVTDGMIQARMQEEIDDLRAALSLARGEPK